MRRLLSGVIVALVAATLVVLPTACGGKSTSPSPSPTASSGLRGTVVVYLMGGEQPQPRAPVTVFVGNAQEQAVAKGRTSTSGEFAFDLPPGTYTVVWRHAAPETVTVEPGRYATVKLALSGK